MYQREERRFKRRGEVKGFHGQKMFPSELDGEREEKKRRRGRGESGERKMEKDEEEEEGQGTR